MPRAKSSRRVGELAVGGALVDVVIPVAGLRERHLEADVRLDQLRDLPQRFAERRARVLGAVRGRVLRRVRRSSASSPRRTPRARSGCSTLSAAAAYSDSNDACTMSRRLPGADAELADLADRQRRLGPAATRGSCGASATARNGVAACVLARVQVAIQPAVLRALHAGRGRLHVVLRVEVRARAVGRAARVHDGELLRVAERLERRQPRMQAEEAVEIDRAASGAIRAAGSRCVGRAA